MLNQSWLSSSFSQCFCKLSAFLESFLFARLFGAFCIVMIKPQHQTIALFLLDLNAHGVAYTSSYYIWLPCTHSLLVWEGEEISLLFWDFGAWVREFFPFSPFIWMAASEAPFILDWYIHGHNGGYSQWKISILAPLWNCFTEMMNYIGKDFLLELQYQLLKNPAIESLKLHLLILSKIST